MWNSAVWESFNLYFSAVFCQYQQDFEFRGKAGHYVIILWSFEISLTFPNFLGSWVFFCVWAWKSAQQLLFFGSFLLVSKKLWVWGEDWALGYNSMKFWDFLKSFGNSWGNSYIPCFLLITTLRFTCGEKKIW